MQNLEEFIPLQIYTNNEDFNIQKDYQNFYISVSLETIEKFCKKNILPANISYPQIYIYLNNISSKLNLEKINKILQFLIKLNIKGIFISDISALNYFKQLPSNISINFFSDFHNIESLYFLNHLYKFQYIIVSEEIYLKNLQSIKTSINSKILVSSNNLKLLNNKNYEYTDGIFYTTKKKHDFIIDNLEKTFWIENSQFKFEKNIIKKNDKYKNIKLKPIKQPLPKLNLRLNSLAQIKALENFIKKYHINPVYSIDFGEIISNKELAQKSAYEILKEVYYFCKKYQIKFEYSTPQVLIERDFERVFEQLKDFCIKYPPDIVIINNIGLFSKFIKTEELNNIKTEIGCGLNLRTLENAAYLQNLHKSFSIDLTDFKDFKYTKNSDFQNKKIKIIGNKKLKTHGLCPLNTSNSDKSGIYCHAMCHADCSYLIKNPVTKKSYILVPDGFCRAHVYKNKMINKVKQIHKLKEQGFTEFSIDLSSKNEEAVTYYLIKVLNQLGELN